MSYKGPYNNANPIPDGEARIVIYNYVPSLAFNVIAVVFFGIALIGHSYLFSTNGKKRIDAKGRGRSTRWFQGLWAFGCLMEVVGYGFRLSSHYSPFRVNNFIIQYFLIVVAPVFFAAALYLSLQYTINLNSANLALSPVRKRFVTIFITIDTLTTIVQIVGAAMIGVAESSRSRGKSSKVSSAQANHILLSGLVLQNASFLVFLAILGVIVFRLHKPAPASTQSTISELEKPHRDRHIRDPALTESLAVPTTHTYSRSYLVAVISSSILVFTRTLYRLGETAQGVWGTASSYESLFGVFEFAPVIAAALIWLARPLRVEMEKMS